MLGQGLALVVGVGVGVAVATGVGVGVGVQLNDFGHPFWRVGKSPQNGGDGQYEDRCDTDRKDQYWGYGPFRAERFKRGATFRTPKILSNYGDLFVSVG